jgi:predicted RNA polymerase sigma factor
MNDDRIKEVGVRYYGDLASTRNDVVVNAVLAGLLKPILSTGVTLVNARSVAAERGMEVTESHSTRPRNYTSLISLKLATTRGERWIEGAEWAFVPSADADIDAAADDTLVMLFMCCHPSLSPPSAIALTLRAVGGLTTAEIASAFMVPEATMAQRISRAKQSIRSSHTPFTMPTSAERGERLRSVLHVLYLMFSEGYTSSIGSDLNRADLSNEAIRLTRDVHGLLPDDGEVAGLLALMLLTDARRAARTGATGELIPLDEQDRSLWNQDLISQGVTLISATLSRGSVGAYQIQAAVAAVHDEAAHVDDTDWAQILALYTVLERMSDNPMVSLNRAIAVAMVHGPATGLELVNELDTDTRLAGHYRLDAVRAHLLERAGKTTDAIAHYHAAAERTTSIPERNYLRMKAARLLDHSPAKARSSSAMSIFDI